MAESSTVTILRNKCVEIEHRIAAYEREIEIARKNLVAVQMTLAVFQSDPNAPYHAQRPVSLSKLFRRGELPGVIFDALRDAPEGLDTRELAIVCLRHRELDADDVVLRRSMAMKIVNTLDKLRIKGRIEKAGMRAGLLCGGCRLRFDGFKLIDLSATLIVSHAFRRQKQNNGIAHLVISAENAVFLDGAHRIGVYAKAVKSRIVLIAIHRTCLVNESGQATCNTRS